VRTNADAEEEDVVTGSLGCFFVRSSESFLNFADTSGPPPSYDNFYLRT